MSKATKNRRLDRVPKQYRSAITTELLGIASKIKRKRKALGITQEGLAELLEIDPTTIQAIEQLRSRPSLELLLAIVKVLKMRITLR